MKRIVGECKLNRRRNALLAMIGKWTLMPQAKLTSCFLHAYLKPISFLCFPLYSGQPQLRIFFCQNSLFYWHSSTASDHERGISIKWNVRGALSAKQLWVSLSLVRQVKFNKPVVDRAQSGLDVGRESIK
jgi:hypothetical protein